MVPSGLMPWSGRAVRHRTPLRPPFVGRPHPRQWPRVVILILAPLWTRRIVASARFRPDDRTTPVVELLYPEASLGGDPRTHPPRGMACCQLQALSLTMCVNSSSSTFGSSFSIAFAKLAAHNSCELHAPAPAMALAENIVPERSPQHLRRVCSLSLVGELGLLAPTEVMLGRVVQLRVLLQASAPCACREHVSVQSCDAAWGVVAA